MSGALTIVGGSDTEQLIVKAYASQTDNILQIQDSSGNVYAGFYADGLFFSHGNTATGNFLAGYQAGNPGTATGNYNVGIGTQALRDLTSGASNFGLGNGALRTLATGTGNVAIGSYSMWNCGTGVLQNTGIGAYTLTNVTGNYNTAIGNYSLNAIVGSHRNTAIGVEAGRYLPGFANDNTFIGHNAGRNSTSARQRNIHIGAYAGKYNASSDILIIDNQDRSSAANEITNAIIYGVMASSPGSQTLALNAIVSLTQINTGATQAAAGAAAGEIWATASHASLPDNVLMIGV